jgi:two-component system phosphate regulon response regulator PhoB
MPRTNILLADDEPYLTHMVAGRLRERGAQVRIAANGEDALAMARQDRPDLIITDLQMPRMSGLEMAAALKSENTTADIPLIMLTSRGHRVFPQQLAATSIKHLVAKPFSFRELLPLIAEFCDIDAGDERDQAQRRAG